MKRLLAMLACVAAFVLAGCSLMGGRRDLTVYAPALAQRSSTDARPAARRWQLVVAQPEAIAPLDDVRIVVMPAAGEIQFYKDARWRDSAPALWQELLLQSFQSAAGAASVASITVPSAAIRADYVLRSELHDFQAEYRAGSMPVVHVRLTFHLVRSSSGEVLATRVFVAEETSSSERLRDVFEAFERAINQVVSAVTGWTMEVADRSM